MGKITKPTELKIPQTVCGLLYGQPGVSKSTTALSAPKPLLIDAENGVSRVQPEYRTDTVQVESYQDILDVLEEDLRDYETIVFDTINEVLIHIEKHIIKEKPKAVSADGKLNMYGYGLRSQEFKSLIAKIKYLGKNIIFVAHEVENADDNGNKIVRPDIVGKASAEITKFLDFIGYCEMLGKVRTVNFASCSKFYAKNSIQLDDYLEIPTLHTGDKNDFLTEMVIKPTIANRQSQVDKLRELEAELVQGRFLIDKYEDANEVMEQFKKMDLNAHNKVVLFNELMAKHAETMVYDKKKGVFVCKK